MLFPYQFKLLDPLQLVYQIQSNRILQQFRLNFHKFMDTLNMEIAEHIVDSSGSQSKTTRLLELASLKKHNFSTITIGNFQGIYKSILASTSV